MTAGTSFLQCAAAGRALPGEPASGDLHLVEPVGSGALIAVIDGLGHGLEAARAASLARDTVRQCAGEPLEAVMERCHAALRRTRGAVMTLAQVDGTRGTLTWMGLGNVEGRLWPAMPGDSLVRQAPPLRGGVLGYTLPRLRTSTLPLSRGDLIVLSTDGLDTDFHEEFSLKGPVQQIADSLLERHWKARDDALVLVMRYLGRS